jgi:hypothetical protein
MRDEEEEAGTMLTKGAAILFGLALCFTSAAFAGTQDLGGGWRVNWPPDSGNMDFFTDLITPDYIVIQISKDFTEPPVGGVFPPRLVDFVQINPDATTVPRIIISDETITNLTGAPWLDFHWRVLNQGDAWFNVPLSAAFNVWPFANKVFTDPGGVFGDPNKASDLDAFGGVVPNGGSFFPGGQLGDGDLVIDVNLNAVSPVSFTFKQFPTPEPASLMLLGLVALCGLRRRSS